jgi:hypothetical protein
LEGESRELGLGSRAAAGEIAQLQPNVAYTSVRVILATGPEDNHPAELVLSRTPRPEPYELPMLDRKRPTETVATFDVAAIDERTRAQLFQGRPDAKITGANTRHCFPLNVLILYDKAKEKARILSEVICSGATTAVLRRRQYLDEIVPDEVVSTVQERLYRHDQAELPKQFFTANRRITLRLLIETIRRSRAPFRPAPNSPPTLTDLQPKIEEILLSEFESELAVDLEFPEEISQAVEYARYFFTSAVRYLGPLRDEPKPVYPLEASANLTEVGYKGEHTAAVLHLHRDTYIKYIPSSLITSIDNATVPVVWTASGEE